MICWLFCKICLIKKLSYIEGHFGHESYPNDAAKVNPKRARIASWDTNPVSYLYLKTMTNLKIT